MIEQIFTFLFGAIVGSFLNVCIYRMPLEQSVVMPGSFCPNCKKPISWFDNVPLISYLVLGGKCRFCRKKISPRYWVVELLTALSFLWFYNLYGFSFKSVYYIIFVAGLIVATFVDIQHRIIPDEISVGGLVVGFLINAGRGIHLDPWSYDLNPALQSFLGIIIGGGIIYLTGFLFDLVYFKILKKGPIQGETESMGGGDVKLLAMIGAFLGWEKAVVTFFLAPFFGAIIGVLNLLIKKDHTIPYGPFLALAAILSMFWADAIIGHIFLIPRY